MKNKGLFSYYLLIAAVVSASPAYAGVRVGNLSRSYADSYSQVNNLRMGTVGGQNANTATAQNTAMPATGLIQSVGGVTTAVDSTGNVIQLPIRVANADLAKRIGMGERVGNVGIERLESCARIYPDGEFAWDTPTAGTGRGGAQTCVAVVEMRVVNADGRGNEAVVARANLAAGDSIRCNIADFPEYSYTEDAYKVEFPPDREPTMDDVVAQMNQEQKQNAGLKIAAGALIGGIGGNIAGKAERGSDSIIGGGKDKMTSAAIGALSGAAIMAGNSYAGKVGGDVILFTGVNAAAGGVMGNIMASGNSVLRVEDCELNGDKQSCLWGVVSKTKKLDFGENDAYFVDIDNLGTGYKCTITKSADAETYNNCKATDLLNVRLEAAPTKTMEQLKKESFSVIKYDANKQFFLDPTQNTISIGHTEGQPMLARVASADTPEGEVLRAVVVGVEDKAFGLTADDWEKMRGDKKYRLMGRNVDGNPYDIDNTQFTMDNFRPLTVDAEDGGIVDISNKARLKSTLTGAGIGGAMGGFVGYQGAKSDIDERWVSAVREYKDRLTTVYCQTGKRYLSQYNDMIVLPSLTE